MAENHPS